MAKRQTEFICIKQCLILHKRQLSTYLLYTLRGFAALVTALLFLTITLLNLNFRGSSPGRNVTTGLLTNQFWYRKAFSIKSRNLIVKYCPVYCFFHLTFLGKVFFRKDSVDQSTNPKEIKKIWYKSNFIKEGLYSSRYLVL